MHRFEESRAFALVFASLVACVPERDPITEYDDELGIDSTADEQSDESGESGESGEPGHDGDPGDDEGMTTIVFDALPEGSGTAEAGDGIEEQGCKKVDLLFVIDNSGSMEDEQINLVGSFPAFIEQIQVQLAGTEGYHVGVISTDAYEYNVGGCEEQEGAMIVATGGEGSSDAVCGPFAEGHGYMTEADDLGLAFSCAAQIGIDGDGNERGLQTMQAAISGDMNKPGGCNEGFLRDDALLVVVIITDEEDDHEIEGCTDAEPGSEGEPADWYEAVVAAKGGKQENVVVLSLIGPPGPDPAVCPMLDKCDGGKIGAEMAPRIAEFTGMFTNGFIGRVCEPSYASFFEEAVAVIDTACEEFEPIG